MVAVEQDAREVEIKHVAEELFSLRPDWVTFYREMLGLRGAVRRAYPTRDALAAFEQTEAYRHVQNLLARLREDELTGSDGNEPTRVITVRLPKSMHESLRTEAFEHRTSMNKLCISKLLQFIDEEKVPTEI
jgi:hypothetical protein